MSDLTQVHCARPEVLLLTRNDAFNAHFQAQFAADFGITHCVSPESACETVQHSTSPVAALFLAPESIKSNEPQRVIDAMKSRFPESPIILLHDNIQLDPLIHLLDQQNLDHCFTWDYDPDTLRSIVRVASMRLRTPVRKRAQGTSAHPSKQKPAVLIVDDEVLGTKYLKKQLERLQSDFDVVCAADAEEALRILAQQSIQVVMTDQRMPGMSGQQLLNHVRQQYPQVIRILTSAYGELDVALDAVNEGRIFRYQKKPWEAQTVLDCLTHALQEADVVSHKQQAQAEDVAQAFETLLQQRRDALCQLLASLPGADDTSAQAYLDTMAAIPTLSPQAAHLRASQETAVEQDLITLLSEAVEGALARLPELSADAQGSISATSTISAIPAIPAISDARRAWVDALNRQCQRLSGTEASDPNLWDTMAEHPLTLLTHVLSPLTRIARPFLQQQAALIITWAITHRLSGQWQLTHGAEGCILSLTLPEQGQA